MGIYEVQATNCVCDKCGCKLLTSVTAEGLDRDEVIALLEQYGWMKDNMDWLCNSCAQPSLTFEISIDAAHQWANDNRSKLDDSRLACEDSTVQFMNQMVPDLSRDLWDSGCWLANVMQEHGADEAAISGVQFVHGQRAFAGDGWGAAVKLAEEYAATGDTCDKPGAELAEKIQREMEEGS